MNRRIFIFAVIGLLSGSATVSAQGFRSGSQELTPRSLVLLVLAGIFVLYKLLGSRL